MIDSLDIRLDVVALSDIAKQYPNHFDHNVTRSSTYSNNHNKNFFKNCVAFVWRAVLVGQIIAYFSWIYRFCSLISANQTMAVVRKKQDDKYLEALRELITLGGGNRQCFDCGQKGPTYVNMTIGSFVCTRCSGVL